MRFMFIWQAPDWPHWRVDAQAVQPALTAARLAQGRMLGMAQTLHLTERGALDAECWSSEAERLIARDQPGCTRLFSLSESLWQHRGAYYAALQATTGQPDMDATRWVIWFLNRLQEAFEQSLSRMQAAVARQRFQRVLDEEHPGLTPSQRKVLVRLFEASPDEFKSGMSTQAFVSLTRASRATAWRELNDLASRGLLHVTGQGRATRYHLTATMAAPEAHIDDLADGYQIYYRNHSIKAGL